MYPKSEIIMIGDRIEADILGANRFGIDSLWFNPKDFSDQKIAVPTYTVKSLSEIVNVI